MEYIIHFLRKQNHNISIKTVIDYFESKEIVRINYSDTQAIFNFYNEASGINFSFFITKRSNLDGIFIDASYYNLNFYVSFPVIRCEAITFYTLDIINEMCKLFDLYIYCNFISEITTFNIENHYMIWKNLRLKYLFQEKDNLFYMKKEMIKQIFTYQQNYKSYYFKTKEELVTFNRLYLLADKQNNILITLDFDSTKPVFIPSFIEYIRLTIDNNVYLYSLDDFLSIARSILSKGPSSVIPGYYLKEKNKKKLRQLIDYRRKIFNNKFVISVKDLMDIW